MRSYVLLLLPLLLFLSGCTIAPVYISKIEGSKIIQLNQKGIKAEIYLRIKNPNSMGFKIFKTGFDCELNDVPVGKAYLKKKIKVKRKSDDVHTFLVESDFTQIGMKELSKLLSIGTAKTVKVRVKGTLKIGKAWYKKEFPFDTTENIKL